MFAELQHVLTGGEQQYPLRTPHARFRLDMVFPAAQGRTVVVEFDGSYWHRDSAERDRLKAEAIEQHQSQWTVVRVREEPLRPTRPNDVTVPLLADPFTTASIVIDHLMPLMPWPAETRARARTYVTGGRRLGQDLAEKLIAERRPRTAPPVKPPAPQHTHARIAGIQPPLW
ncbi:hypothetical protein ABZS95_26825 [Streptomyces sp. NPDC005479]|uniref:hypothetical protein n=1 Tax=Streptomyces sp. NPDC005479 TaxID=3154879 RepID=UPI0033A9E1C9